MERLDKFISNQTSYTRKEVKNLIKNKKITINEEIVSKSDLKINPDATIIKINGIEIKNQKYLYIMLNKPKGYVSATTDKLTPTVLDLLPEKYLHRNLFPAGRLDKDTTGLMLITDDGNFAHNMLSPKKHISKTYNVTIDLPMTNEMVTGFTKGVVLNDGECKSANLKITGPNKGIVTLTEGRYHQIKRMFGCYKAKVIELERIALGNFYLPDDLNIGEYREFTEEELKKVLEK